MSTIGERIKARRVELQISRQALADALGLGYETIRQWEVGIAEPRPKLYSDISHALRSSKQAIVFGITSGLLSEPIGVGLDDYRERLAAEIAQLSVPDQLKLIAEIANRLEKDSK